MFSKLQVAALAIVLSELVVKAAATEAFRTWCVRDACYPSKIDSIEGWLYTYAQQAPERTQAIPTPSACA